MSNEFYIYLCILTPLLAFFLTPFLNKTPNFRDILGPIGGLISFYCSILLDRIEYASNLQEANQKLNRLNTSLERMNKKVRKIFNKKHNLNIFYKCNF